MLVQSLPVCPSHPICAMNIAISHPGIIYLPFVLPIWLLSGGTPAAVSSSLPGEGKWFAPSSEFNFDGTALQLSAYIAEVFAQE